MANFLDKLEQNLQFEFSNKELLITALTHRSYLNENPRAGRDHNERLEFLGDAVLELIVTEYLYQNYSNPEGELTSWRASLVNYQTMGDAADSLGINNFLYLSRGETKDTGKARQVILANALEAVIGAIYLDSGYNEARLFVERILISRLPEIIEKGLWRDAKSYFQELAQERFGITPGYKVLQESGPDHAKKFLVGVFLGEDQVSTGQGTSKQEAEQEAAQNALVQKGWA